MVPLVRALFQRNRPRAEAETGLAPHATACPHDLLCPARLGVVTANYPSDLSGRTATIIHEYDLALTHRPHGRLLLQDLGKCSTRKAHDQQGGNKANRLHHAPLLGL